MDRRRFLQTSALALPVAAIGPQLKTSARAPDRVGLPEKIIDTHTHFFDPTRPQGVPWPPKNNELLYRRTLPDDYRKVAVPCGVTGTVVVEASSWVEDNQWILDLAARDPFIVGLVGRLQPGDPDFARHLKRFARNPLFRGIRVRSNELADIAAGKPGLADMKRLATADLSLDVVGGARMLPHALTLAQQAPSLKIVIDHLPFDPPLQEDLRQRADRALNALAERPGVFAKVSHVLRREGDRTPVDVERYRGQLDMLWRLFGPDRVVYGSNWPVSKRLAPYADIQQVVMQYVTARGREDTDKYFWKNSQAAYGWKESEG